MSLLMMHLEVIGTKHLLKRRLESLVKILLMMLLQKEPEWDLGLRLIPLIENLKVQSFNKQKIKMKELRK
jgi:hypothetical protein